MNNQKSERSMQGKKKSIKPICRHLDWDNEFDCQNESEYMCECCAEPVCEEHRDRTCPYGGMGYLELD